MAITKTWITVGVVGDSARPRVYEEEGEVQSIVADELDYFTNYVAGAGCISDGLQCLAMQRVEFQTLRRNNLSATFNAARRQGLNTPLEGGWQVYYDYTSLYAISSCILYVSQNGTQVGQYQGVADYNTSQLTFGIPANELACCGAQYQLHVVVIDIFGQSYTTPVTTITTDTLNLVSMEYASSTTSSVTFDLDYWLDSGFASGWLDYWNEGDDPETDQPQDHYHFFEGDTQVTADGLDEGTTYIFRVTITLDDGQGTEIYTSYQYASTAETDWTTVPFFIENTTENTNSIKIKPINSPSSSPTLEKSEDGLTWESVYPSRYDETTINIPPYGKLYFRGNNPNGFNQTGNIYRISCTTSHNIGGNLLSLLNGSTYTEITSIPDNAFAQLFYQNVVMVDASRANFGNATHVGRNSCERMFYSCWQLIGTPDLSKFTTLDDDALDGIFWDCKILETPADLSNVETIGERALQVAYKDCVRLTEPSQMPKVKSLENESSINSMYRGCSRLRTGMNLLGVTRVGTNSMVMLYNGCSRLTTAYFPNFTGNPSDVASGWLGDSATLSGRGTVYAPTTNVKEAIEAAGTTILPTNWTVVVQS